MASSTYPPAVSPPRLGGPERASRSGIWVGIFAITMSFAAFTSALYVRQASGDGVHIVLPPVIYANTLALVLSSFTMEMSRRRGARALVPEALGLRNGMTLLAFCVNRCRVISICGRIPVNTVASSPIASAAWR